MFRLKKLMGVAFSFIEDLVLTICHNYNTVWPRKAGQGCIADKSRNYTITCKWRKREECCDQMVKQ